MTTIKNKAVILALAAAVAGTLAFPWRAFSQNINIDLGGRHHHRRFDHPEIDAAMGHLQQAHNNLQNAAHDFDGHRVKALKAVDHAIEQCNAAVRYAESHDR